ncbi:MAG: response regulator, partial [Lachnospiraceae bacterium]|nr:response regulator [Lachnospiraceae bacterium]
MEKLLLVEDDSALVQRLREYLSAEGFHCLSADTQAAAVALLDAEKPDLSLVDITLPEGNGFA